MIICKYLEALVTHKNKPMSNMVVIISLLAQQKNDYHLVRVTNTAGMVRYTAQMIGDEITRQRNMCIMDYTSTLQQCSQHIVVQIPCQEEVCEMRNALNQYASTADDNDLCLKLEQANNPLERSFEKEYKVCQHRPTRIRIDIPDST